MLSPRKFKIGDKIRLMEKYTNGWVQGCWTFGKIYTISLNNYNNPGFIGDNDEFVSVPIFCESCIFEPIDFWEEINET